MNDLIVLDIGCGPNKKEHAIGVDMRRGAADVVADANHLPFRNESFSHVYTSHLIEHFSHFEAKNVLREWTRVLRKKGIMEIRCPDLRFRALIFFFRPSWQNMVDIYGAQDYGGNYHRCGFSFGLLRDLLESCGIVGVRRVIKGYKGVPFIPDCLHIRGVKE